MRNLKLILGVILAFGSVILSYGFLGMDNVMAESGQFNQICAEDSGADEEMKRLAGCNTTKRAEESAVGLINLAISILALVAVVMIIISGFIMATSNGEAAKVQNAKNRILYAVVGLIVAILSYAIINFVIDKVFVPKEEKKEEKTSLEVQDIRRRLS